jgi:hypothetical protein
MPAPISFISLLSLLLSFPKTGIMAASAFDHAPSAALPALK